MSVNICGNEVGVSVSESGSSLLVFSDLVRCLGYSKKSEKRLLENIPNKYRVVSDGITYVTVAGTYSLLICSRKENAISIHEFLVNDLADAVSNLSSPERDSVALKTCVKDVVVKGNIIGRRWKILDHISDGGNGSVYECLELANRIVRAIKFEEMDSCSLREEILVYPKLKGIPGIVKVFGHGSHKGLRYLVMERLQPLKDFSGKIAACLVPTLKELANKGYSHNDIKPDNVMLRDDGSVVLIDIGLIRKIGETFDGPVNALLSLMGLDAHMGMVTPRNDLESLVYSMQDSLPWDCYRSSSKIFEMKKKFVKKDPILSSIHRIDYDMVAEALSKR